MLCGGWDLDLGNLIDFVCILSNKCLDFCNTNRINSGLNPGTLLNMQRPMSNLLPFNSGSKKFNLKWFGFLTALWVNNYVVWLYCNYVLWYVISFIMWTFKKLTSNTWTMCSTRVSCLLIQFMFKRVWDINSSKD